MIALLIVVSFVSQPAPASHAWEGRLAIGDNVYAVVGESRATADGVVHFSLRISSGDRSALHTVSASLSHAGGHVVINGVRSQLPARIAASWHRQLRLGLEYPLASSAEYTCRGPATERVCDSDTLVKIDDSLSGRVRMIYNHRHAREIRFFSLAEWTNPFGQYVSLSLNIQ